MVVVVRQEIAARPEKLSNRVSAKWDGREAARFKAKGRRRYLPANWTAPDNKKFSTEIEEGFVETIRSAVCATRSFSPDTAPITSTPPDCPVAWAVRKRTSTRRSAD